MKTIRLGISALFLSACVNLNPAERPPEGGLARLYVSRKHASQSCEKLHTLTTVEASQGLIASNADVQNLALELRTEAWRKGASGVYLLGSASAGDSSGFRTLRGQAFRCLKAKADSDAHASENQLAKNNVPETTTPEASDAAVP